MLFPILSHLICLEEVFNTETDFMQRGKLMDKSSLRNSYKNDSNDLFDDINLIIANSVSFDEIVYGFKNFIESKELYDLIK